MRVLIYARVSTSHHQQRPEAQVTELEKYCAARGWTIVERVIDHGFSGSTDALQRPGLRRVSELVRAKAVDCVLVWKLDRLFRSLKGLILAVEEYEKSHVKLVSMSDGIDATTAQGRLMMQVLGSLFEFEKSLTREKTLMGLAYARSQGKKLGRPRKCDRDQVIDLRAKGRTYRAIAEELNVSVGAVCAALRSVSKTPSEPSSAA